MLAKPFVIRSVVFGSRNATFFGSRVSVSRREPLRLLDCIWYSNVDSSRYIGLLFFLTKDCETFSIHTTFEVCSKKLSISVREWMIAAFARAANAGSAPLGAESDSLLAKETVCARTNRAPASMAVRKASNARKNLGRGDARFISASLPSGTRK